MGWEVLDLMDVVDAVEKVSSSVSNFIPQGKRGEYKEVTPKYQNDKVLSRVEINLNIVKVYEYSIPTRLGVCEGRKVRAALETLERPT